MYVNHAFTVFTNCLHRRQLESVSAGAMYLAFIASIVTTLNSSPTVQNCTDTVFNLLLLTWSIMCLLEIRRQVC